NLQPLRELIKESDVVLKQQPDVIYFVHQSRHPVDAKPKRESGELFRVNPHALEHMGMYHATTAQLDPTGVFADPAPRPAAYKAGKVEFRGRFGKWKVRWPESSSQLWPEHQLNKLLNSSLQVSHRDSAIDIEPFELEEHRIVSRIGRVPAEHSSRRHDPERRFASLHRMYLDGRSLAPQGKAFRQVESIRGITRRVARRDIEGVKVIVRGLDLRPIFYRIAH